MRDASFTEYVGWYLARERRKRQQEADAPARAWNAQLAEMQRLHPAKLRSWFPRACWTVVSLDAIGEAMSLVCLDNWETRGNRLVSGAGPDHRLAARLVVGARAAGYFDNPAVLGSDAVEGHFRQAHIGAFRVRWPDLAGGNRIVICDLNAGEKADNPSGSFYLHDGTGRLLAYLYLVAFEGRRYNPVEAFLATQA